MSVATAPHAELKAAYEDVAYVGRPNHHSDPGRLAAIARLFGHAPADPARARVLEVGCGDAANLLPLAMRYPDARFVGCDLSALLMGHARTTAEALGLRNVELVEGDLKALAPTLGTFDYVVAHGFYSWVPADVREAFVAMLGRQLAPGGLAFVSYNVLPGCFVRRVSWDALRVALGGGGTPRERLDDARRELSDLAEAWSAMPGIPGYLGRDLAAAGERSDSALYHDDLGAINDAMYFTSFVQHVGRHGLAFLAEAEPATMSMAALPARMVALAAAADPIAREQYLDFARVRRFRQSILGRADAVARAGLRPDAVPDVHLSAVTGIVQERAAGAAPSVEGPLIDFLVDAYPASVPFGDAVAQLVAQGMPARDARTLAMRTCFSGAVDMHAHPLPVARAAAERPRAWAYARWQVGTPQDWVPSLRHTAVRVDDPTARALLAACDGTRDRAALARAASLDGDDAPEIVDRLLERFALAGLLEA
jgi:SAM-dependent methyltransferase